MELETYTGRVLLKFLDEHHQGRPFLHMRRGKMFVALRDESKSRWGQKFNRLARLYGRLSKQSGVE